MEFVSILLMVAQMVNKVKRTSQSILYHEVNIGDKHVHFSLVENYFWLWIVSI